MTPTFTKALERASTFFERPITLRSLRDPSKKAEYTEPRHFVTAYQRVTLEEMMAIGAANLARESNVGVGA